MKVIIAIFLVSWFAYVAIVLQANARRHEAHIYLDLAHMQGIF